MDLSEFSFGNLLGCRLSKEALDCLSIYCIMENIEKPILEDIATFLCSSDVQQCKSVAFITCLYYCLASLYRPM